MLCCSIWLSAPSFWVGGGLESHGVGRVYGADCAVRHHPHRTHDLRRGSQDHHPSKNSVQKAICYNTTSIAPHDGYMYPKHVELRIHFTLFHEEDARSNKPLIYSLNQQSCCYELLATMQCSSTAIPAKNFTAIFLQCEANSQIATHVKTLLLHIIKDRTSNSFRPTSVCRNLTERGNGNKTLPRA